MMLAGPPDIFVQRLAQGAGGRSNHFFPPEYLEKIFAKGRNWGPVPSKVDEILKKQVQGVFQNMTTRPDGVLIYSPVYNKLKEGMRDGSAQGWLDGLLAGATTEGDVAEHAAAGARSDEFISVMEHHIPPMLARLPW